MTDKTLKEARRHVDAGLPVSYYRMQPPYDNYEQLECHWHGEMELFLVERGRVRIQCGRDYLEAEQGDLAFFTSGELHAALPLDEGPLDYSAVVFSPEFLCGGEQDVTRMRYVAPVAEGRLRVQKLVRGTDDREREILRAFSALQELLVQRPPAYELRVRARLLDIFAGLSVCGELQGEVREKGSTEGIKEAIDYIRRNYRRQLTIEELANVSHMSGGHFCRQFKKYTFKTPVQYINSVRLSAAMELLLNSDRKVLDIALDTGFNSLGYFTGVFKQSLSCTPTEFRKR